MAQIRLDRPIKSILIHYCIPSYFKNHGINYPKEYSFKSDFFRLGFGIDLSNHTSAVDYLKSQLSSKTFKNLRQDKNRLAKKFKIILKVFYGEISEQEYNNIIKTLKQFIEERFRRNVMSHSAYSRWEKYEESVIHMVRQKECSIFVLYNNEMPIAITINYHLEPVLITSISSFDQRFHHFSLGKLMFWELIDWCTINNYHLIDLTWGEFDYKIKFSNAVYRYRTDIIYRNGSIYKRIMAYIIMKLLKIKYQIYILKKFKTLDIEKKFSNRWLMNKY